MKKYYTVKTGKKPGIYETWEECQNQVVGYPNAQFKCFETLEEAQTYLNNIHLQKGKEKVHPLQQEKIETKVSLLKNELTSDQKIAYEYMKSGENVFVTGEAGTGKSFVVNRFIAEMEKQHKNILVCAPTGIAAINVGGATIHRCFQASLEPQINIRIKTAPKCVQDADIIIIDEISMCRVDLFDYVVRVIAKAEELSLKRKQLIVIGDFFQLPPVTTKEDRQVLEKVYPDYKKGFAFESKNWVDFHFKVVVLKNVKRQNDSVFIQELNKVRIGNPSSIDYFNKNASKEKINNGIILCARNAVAKKINEEELDKISSRATIYKSQVNGDVKASDKPTEDALRLKVGARVIVLINDSESNRFQNGSLGEVVALEKECVHVKIDKTQEEIMFNKHEWEIENYTVEEQSEHGETYKNVKKQKVGSFKQIPLKLAYAITIHKSQGQTYDKVNLIPYSFSCGQLYVALSRVKSIQGLCLLQRMTQEYLICDSKVKEFYNINEYVDKKQLMEKLGKIVYDMDKDIQMLYPDEIKKEILKIRVQLGEIINEVNNEG